jgi:hypothetical protein
MTPNTLIIIRNTNGTSSKMAWPISIFKISTQLHWVLH